MLIRSTSSIASSELTSEAEYLNRRQLIAAGLGVVGAGAGLVVPSTHGVAGTRRLQAKKSIYSTIEQPSRYRDITTYNNFIEFGARKTDPSYFANALTTRPWMVTVDGLVRKSRVLDWDDLLNRFELEERIYRLRCVEAWSMVVPWVGFPLNRLLRLVEPLSSAKFVRFETVYRPKEMRGQRKARPIIPWPYAEGLRLDEALHPLTILAVGLYGRALPNQNGAPVRLVVPWKYGFKSIKSIVRITLTEEQPVTSWNRQSPQEYGFYANVNPAVDHPSWSQARERRVGLGTSRFSAWRPTLMFNGYGEEVSHLYSGMDLRKDF